MSSWLILTYFEITAISSRCSSGRKLALPPPSRSWAMISCKRSFATWADFGLLPKSRESRDILLASEQALQQTRLDVVDTAPRPALAEEAGAHVLLGVGGFAFLLVDDRGALVRGLQHFLGLGDDADDLDPQDFLDVLVRQHFAGFDAARVVAGDQQVFLDRFAAFEGAPRFGLEDAEDAVGVAYRRDFRVGHDNRFVGEGQRHHRAVFDAGRRVADHVVEGHVFEFLEDFLDPGFGQRILVAGLRGRQHEQIVAVLVLDHRLGQRRFAVDHVDQVIDHAAFAAHDQVEVAQADVEVDHGRLETAQGEAGREAGAGGGLADATLAGGHGNDAGHFEFSLGYVNGLSLSEGQRGHGQFHGIAVLMQADDRRLAGEVGGNAGLEGAVHAGDRDQFGFEAGGENPGLRIAVGAGQGAAAQGRVDVDAAVGDDFGTGADHCRDDQVAAPGIDALARAQRLVHDHRGGG